MKKALIIKSGAIGDLILISPLLSKYKELNPSESITLLCGQSCSHVISQNPDISNVIAFDDDIIYNGNTPQKLLETFKIVKMIKGHDKCFILHHDHRWEIIADIASINEKHILESYVFNYTESYKKCLNIKEIAPLKFYPDKSFEPLGENYICIASGGARNIKNNNPCRRWAHYPALTKMLLKETDYNIIMLGSSEDSPGIKSERIIDLCGKTSLSEAYSIICNAKIFIGNDSGLLHLAGCTETKTVGIFTSTSPYIILPSDSKTIAISSKLRCSPCERFGNFSSDCNLECIEDIKPEEVFNLVLSLNLQESQ